MSQPAPPPADPNLLQQFLPRFLRWASAPQYGDLSTRQSARILYYSQGVTILAALLSLGVGAFTHMEAITMLGIGLFSLIILAGMALLRQKRLKTAGALTLSVYLALAVFLQTEDPSGMHDISILIYPAVIFVAGLSLDRRLLILFTAASNLAILGVAALEASGRLDTYFTRLGYPDTWLDALVAVIILSTIAVLVNFFIQTNQSNFRALQQQEEALRAVNQRLQLALQAAGMSEWELDLKSGKFQHAEWFDQLAGDKERESALEFIHPHDRPAVQQALERLRRGEAESFELTHRLMQESGEARWAQTWGRLARGADNQPAKIFGLTMDITERKRAEIALQESEALYRQAIEAVDAVPYFLDYRQEAYTFMGAKIEQITGYRADEMTPELFNHLVQYSIPIGEIARYSWQEAAQRARRGEVAIWRTDNLIRRKDGSLGWLLDSAVQVRDARGEVYGSIGILQDITERKQAEAEILKLNAELEQQVEARTQELEVSRDRLAQALRLANMAYWEYDIPQGILRLNDQFYDVLRTSAAQAGGYEMTFEQYLQRFVHPEDIPLVRNRKRTDRPPSELGLYAGNQYEYRVLCGDGTVQYAVVDYQVIYNEQQEPVLAYGYHMDITQRKQAEMALAQRSQQLESANRELEAFAYTISHDLRAPLRAVQGYARVLAEDYAAQLSPEARQALDRISHSALRMSALIDDLLEFSRLGRQPLNRQWVQPNRILEQALSDLSPEYESRPVQFEIQELPACQADPALLHLVFENLLSNALKYSRQRNPALIAVGSLKRNGQTVYFVRDNGIGFDMKYAEKIFGVFQRLHSDEEYEGTGIGLATVQRIVQRHGGEVWVEAQVDRGATFYFTLGE